MGPCSCEQQVLNFVSCTVVKALSFNFRMCLKRSFAIPRKRKFELNMYTNDLKFEFVAILSVEKHSLADIKKD